MPTKGQKALAAKLDKKATMKAEKPVDKTVNLTDVSGSSKMARKAVAKKAKKVTTSSKRKASARY